MILGGADSDMTRERAPLGEADSPVVDPAADGWSFEPENGFIGLVGPIWSRTAPEGRRFGFVAEARHANLIGIVQGGMIMTFADRALGILAWEAAAGPACVTVSLEVQFVGAGRIGSFIECSGEVVRRTSGLVFMRGLVTSGRAVVASCQGTWKILSDRRRSADSGSAARDA